MASSSDIWLRPEYEGREGELETRADFEARTGISVQSLSSMFTRYADRVPPIVKKWGKYKYFVAVELDEFVAWIKENTGTRSEVDVRRAELARVNNAIEEAESRVTDRQADLDRAKRELAKFQRQARKVKEEITYLEQVQ